MNRKQKIIVSVTGIFLVLLILVGLTYAYFLTRIVGNTNDNSISLTTANLELVYGDGTTELLTSDTKLVPSADPINTKDFTVTNNGDDTNYAVIIENVVIKDATTEEETTFESNDFVYTLSCEKSDGTSCNGVDAQITLPMTDSILVEDFIEAEDTHTYLLTLWYLDTGIDQSADMNKTLEARINIKDNSENATVTKTLADTIMNDTRITKNSGTPSFIGVETNEVGMYSAEDDYGTSWYFRGAQSYNYINFAGFTWRIVRINGDGSVRIILDGTLDKVYRKNEDGTVSTTPAGESNVFNSSYNDNAYVGYMYGTVGSDNYDSTHQNLYDSTIKDTVDLFYETYIENDTNNYHYGEYLSDTLFCGDKTLASSTIGTDNTGLGYGENTTYYAASERLYYSSGETYITTATPTLECAKGASDTYSRYTANSTTTTKGVSVNNDLEYPIGLLSADELVMAGAWRETNNQSYYLYDAYGYDTPTLNNNWWTMSHINFNGYVSEFISNFYVSLFDLGGEIDAGVRPVLSLSAATLLNSGDGTYESPYEILES